jgi:hypothetical protein
MKVSNPYRLLPLLVALLMLGCDYDYVKNPGPVGPGNNDTSGTGNPTTGQIELTLTPAQDTLFTSEVRQLTALVTGTTNTSVAWTLNPAIGTISTSGLYTAPESISSDSMLVTVRAASVADSTKFATATLLIVRESNGGGDTLPPGIVCFERDVLPIFQNSCGKVDANGVGCHNSVSRQKGLDFTSYSSIIASVEAYQQHEGEPGFQEILEKITEDRPDKRMPPPGNAPLTAEQIETLRKWINQGAKETKCPETGGCDTMSVTFSGTIQPILNTNCTGCHGSNNPPKGIDLTTHAGVMVVANDGRLYKAVNHLAGAAPMPRIPPNGARLLSECIRARINAWLNKGAPNN